jgi:hypothetical protein
MDPRLGRRWNIDPEIQFGISPYSTFGNNPIFYNDIEGNTVDNDVFKNSKMGEVTIVETGDTHDNEYVDGAFAGEHKKGWGEKNYGDARRISIDKSWTTQYLKEDGKILGLAAYKNEGLNNDIDRTTYFHLGVVDLGGMAERNFEPSNTTFYQSFYVDQPLAFDLQNAGVQQVGYSLESNGGSMSGATRWDEGQFEGRHKEDLGVDFDVYLHDEPQRQKSTAPNEVFRATTSLIHKTTSGQLVSLLTVQWGFAVTNSSVQKIDVSEVNIPESNPDLIFHIQNRPQ